MAELMKRGQLTVDLLLQLRQPTTRVPIHLSPDARKLIISAQSRGRGTDLKGDQSYTAHGVCCP
jgi:hypothetical protein